MSEFEGKQARIVFQAGYWPDGRPRFRTVQGKIICFNESYIVNKDRFGKLHFITMRNIEKIDEMDGVENVQTENAREFKIKKTLPTRD